MMKGLAGKVALVTGASSGIGQAIAQRLATEGCHVVIGYRRDREGAERTQAEALMQAAAAGHGTIKTLLLPGDAAQEADILSGVSTILEEFGALDILVNNAGIQAEYPSHAIPTEKFDQVLAVNLRGPYLYSREVIQHWLHNHCPGVILNVSSVHETIPRPQYLSYSLSKGGMGNLTKTLALEYADRHIRVNGLAPGATVTPINQDWVDDPEKKAVVESHIPMGRPGTSEEMAAAAAFLVSDEAAYITGQTLFIDGGLTLYADFREAWSA